MTDQIIFANAKLILASEVIPGSIVISGGVITDIAPGTNIPAGAQNMEGRFLAPGMVELHTDNLERHLAPRPKVEWPYGAAILAHDSELAGTGITTVFDAVRVGSIQSASSKGYGKYARRMVDEILKLRSQNRLRISHHIHLRAEVCSQTLIEELDEFTPADRIGILSMMDHTPGQRQFTDLSKFETYVRGKHHFTEAEYRDYVEFLYGIQADLGERHEIATAETAKRLGAVLASHDDTTPQQVTQSRAHGAKLAEFPTTLAAAQACKSSSIDIMMGAPNLIRGGSHSGNVAAADLAREGLLDILSSDYVPSGLLMAAVGLGDLWGDLPRGIACVTSNPARAAGLTDRGELAVGKRADLICFQTKDEITTIEQTWCAGRRVF